MGSIPFMSAARLEQVENKVRAINEALSAMRDQEAKVWNYSCGHSILEMYVGEPVWLDGPHSKGNIFLLVQGCDYLGGPVFWPNQQLTVTWKRWISGEREESEYEILDPSVGFCAVGAVFDWVKNYDMRRQWENRHSVESGGGV